MVKTYSKYSTDYYILRDIMADKQTKKLAHNTYIVKGLGEYYVTLHGHKIITIASNYVIMRDCGWQTVTTKQRLNQFGVVNIWQKNRQWYYTDENGETQKWDGYLRVHA